MSEIEEAVSKGICMCCRRTVIGGAESYVKTGLCPKCRADAE